ncbi:hypothetical protein LIER_41395 [Lithospermum erythrorhizon]|uniref:FAD-binding PCMH-type domain-containing protein n=1 Tax=Lithospermum erythrorhizon TaxID=34254 RepID=A0AAV3RA69_LITER
MNTPTRTMHTLLLSIIFLISSSPKISANTSDDFVTCIQSYNNSDGSIYTPENSSFSTLLQSMVQNFRAQTEAPLKPIAILTPSHETEMQAAIHCSKIFGLQIRVRSGGHDFEGLSYLSHVPFVIINLVNLRSISIDTEKKTAWVEAGAILGELYHAIAMKSPTLAFPTGTCPTIGVGGHFSGGGFGMMSRKFALSADHVIDAKIISYEGQVLDRKSMGEDLFWAIRGGGGGSFGIVTSWKIELVTVPETVTVFNVSRTLDDDTAELVHKWQYVAPKLDENLFIRIFIDGINGTVHTSFKSLFIGGANDLLNIMQKSFPELGLTKADCVEMTWIESVLYMANYPRGESIDVLLNREYAGTYFKVKSDFVTHPISVDGLEGLFEMLQEEDLPYYAGLQFSPYGGKMEEISESSLPFPHRAGIVFMIETALMWSEADTVNADRYMSWINNYYKYMTTYVSKSPRRAYVNYRDLDLGVNKYTKSSTSNYMEAKKWGMQYFNNNFQRLVHVKSKVDPTNFFRHEQSIPPF